MTKELFREDSYLKNCTATVVSQVEQGIELDQTVFYPTGGGQPGDQGTLILVDGSRIDVLDSYHDRETGKHLHRISEGVTLQPGETVTAEINWVRRYKLMRSHSCMHLLCAVIPVLVTGGSVRDDGTARLDFDLPEPPNKAEVEEKLNALTQSDHPMSLRWITDAEMQAQPELVRTMSVMPPMGTGRVRLVEFAGADLQPCGGTHVANSREIGAVKIQSIKKKGKLNRRITVALIQPD